MALSFTFRISKSYLLKSLEGQSATFIFTFTNPPVGTYTTTIKTKVASSTDSEAVFANGSIAETSSDIIANWSYSPTVERTITVNLSGITSVNKYLHVQINDGSTTIYAFRDAFNSTGIYDNGWIDTNLYALKNVITGTFTNINKMEVTAPASFTSSVNINELYVSGATSFNTLNVSGVAQIYSVNILSPLTIVEIDGNAYTRESLFANRIIATGVTTLNNLNVTGTTTLNSLQINGAFALSSLDIPGFSSLNTLRVTGATLINSLTTSNLFVNSFADINGRAYVESSLYAGFGASNNSLTNTTVTSVLSANSQLVSIQNIVVRDGLTLMNDNGNFGSFRLTTSYLQFVYNVSGTNYFVNIAPLSTDGNTF